MTKQTKQTELLPRRVSLEDLKPGDRLQVVQPSTNLPFGYEAKVWNAFPHSEDPGLFIYRPDGFRHWLDRDVGDDHFLLGLVLVKRTK
jgi:hypothetical protein